MPGVFQARPGSSGRTLEKGRGELLILEFWAEGDGLVFIGLRILPETPAVSSGERRGIWFGRAGKNLLECAGRAGFTVGPVERWPSG